MAKKIYIIKYNKEECHKEALKYNYRSEFQINNNAVYCSANRNKWLNEICNHMIEKKHPDGYWTKEKCQEEALKYNYKSDFQKNANVAYLTSQRRKWFVEICSHMTKKSRSVVN